ncbi:MAG: precorrin-3B synthase [Pseudomonadota bacterium]
MSAPAIRGWCPGAHRPMASGDGLVVRVRPPLGELTAAQAQGLAAAARANGNGLIDLTNRANLQLRGVSEARHEPLLEHLSRLGLLDQEAETEGRRNIVVNPFRGGGSDDPQTQIAADLADALRAPEFAPLPSKFGFVVDARPQRSLSEISGDIRIEASGNGLIVRADGRDNGQDAGDPQAAVELALDLARWFIASGGIGADGRGRMARHLAAGATLPANLSGDVPPNRATQMPGAGPHSGGLLVATGFGQLAPEDLEALADFGLPVLRLTPWRMIFLPEIADPEVLAGHATLLTDPSNPLLRVHACAGAAACPQSSVETRALGRNLARGLPPDASLHISGCAKGCAHPRAAAFTLVGRDGQFDLVTNGAPWDEPIRHGITPGQVADIIDG